MVSAKELNEKKFMSEYENCKRFVDAGIEDYFILANNTTFDGITEIGNTTLDDIEEIFGKEYISLFRFAVNFNNDGENNREKYQTLRIRRLTNLDRKRLRNDYRFFPSNCWVCELKDAAHFGLVLPFTQDEKGNIKFLADNSIYRKNFDKKSSGFLSNTAFMSQTKTIIETAPDYFDCLLAVTKYKNTCMLIPIKDSSVKKTFKNRERDADGVKRHLIHNVKEHERATLKNTDSVQSHLRGRSELTINGIDVVLMASYEWSKRYFENLKSRLDK